MDGKSIDKWLYNITSNNPRMALNLLYKEQPSVWLEKKIIGAANRSLPQGPLTGLEYREAIKGQQLQPYLDYKTGLVQLEKRAVLDEMKKEDEKRKAVRREQALLDATASGFSKLGKTVNQTLPILNSIASQKANLGRIETNLDETYQEQLRNRDAIEQASRLQAKAMDDLIAATSGGGPQRAGSQGYISGTNLTPTRLPTFTGALPPFRQPSTPVRPQAQAAAAATPGYTPLKNALLTGTTPSFKPEYVSGIAARPAQEEYKYLVQLGNDAQIPDKDVGDPQVLADAVLVSYRRKFGKKAKLPRNWEDIVANS